MQIKASTIYTKENFREFQKYHYFHSIKIARILFTLFGLFFVVVGVLGLLYQDYPFGCIELLLGILLIIEFNTAIIPNMQTKRILKTDSMILGLKNDFTFYEDCLEVVNSRSTTKIPYEELYSYHESDTYFYLYLNKISAFLVDKNGIEEGKEQALKHLLEEKCQKKK